MNIKKTMTAAIFGAALSAASFGANAFSLGGYQGPVDIKFSGYTSELHPVAYGDETTWGAGFVTSIQEAGNPGNTLWASSGAETMSYMLYGIADQGYTSGGTYGTNIFNVGCTGGPCDGKIHLDFYLNPTGGSFSNLAAAGIQTTDRSGFGTMNQITNSNLLMSWVMVPGIVTADDGSTAWNELLTTLLQNATGQTLPASGQGNFYAECVVGSGTVANAPCKNALQGFDTNSYANGADLLGGFHLTAVSSTDIDPFVQRAAANGWGGAVNDPVRGVVPEPGMLALLGAGLLGFAGIRRSRRAK